MIQHIEISNKKEFIVEILNPRDKIFRLHITFFLRLIIIIDYI